MSDQSEETQISVSPTKMAMDTLGQILIRVRALTASGNGRIDEHTQRHIHQLMDSLHNVPFTCSDRNPNDEQTMAGLLQTISEVHQLCRTYNDDTSV